MAQQYIGTGRIDGRTQTITITGTSAAVSNAFGTQTRMVRYACNTASHVTTGAAPTATTSDPFVPANAPEYFTVSPGQKLAAIRASTDGLVTATNGTATVTEVP